MPALSRHVLALGAAMLVCLALLAFDHFDIARNTGFWHNEIRLLHTREGVVHQTFVSPEELLELPVQLFLLAPAALLAALALAPGLSWTAGLLPRPSRRRYAGLAVFSACATLGISAFVLEFTHVTVDELAYRTQSQILLRGELWLGSVEPSELTSNYLMLEKGGKYCAAYYPVWPAMLAPGTALGNPYLVLPLICAAALAACVFAWRGTLPGPVCFLAAMQLATSPLLLINAATLLNETASLLLLAFMVGCSLRAERGGSAVWPLLSGTALGLCLLVRPLTALAWGAAVASHLIASGRPHARLSRHAAALIPVAVAVAAMLAYNAQLTGSAWTTPFEAYDPEVRLGFGERGDEHALHHPARSALNLAITAARATHWLFGWPISFVFVLCAGLPGAHRAHRLDLWARIALYHAAAYMLLYHPGVGLTGPHYYLELAMPLAALSAIGFARLAERAAAAEGPLARGLPAALALSMTAVGLVTFWPFKLSAAASLGEFTREPYRAIDSTGLRDAIVFLRPYRLPAARGRVRGTRVIHPDLVPPGGIEYLNDPDDPAVRERYLALHGRGRKAYVYDWKRLAVIDRR